jgi:hypothetical protein
LNAATIVATRKDAIMSKLIKRERCVKVRAFVFGACVTCATAVVTLGTAASAAPVFIVGYDIAQTPRSGFGCWFHDYDGTVTNTGRTVSGSVVCSADGSQIANYSGGSGTLNDGVISTSTIGTHLFTTRNADDGGPISPVITLHLGGTYFVNAIHIFGGDLGGNAIPGALNGMTVEIGGSSLALATTPFGALNAIGVAANDQVDLTHTTLAVVATNQIVLRNFTASFFGFPFDQFSITEITVDGSPAAFAVSIDIKPGSFPNSINTGSGGKTTVAILSSRTFDAFREVDQTTLTFGRTGDEKSLADCGEPEDVNGDSLPDLVCHFQTGASDFVPGDASGVLKGKTLAGVPIQGTDSVRIIR